MKEEKGKMKMNKKRNKKKKKIIYKGNFFLYTFIFEIQSNGLTLTSDVSPIPISPC